MSFYVFYFNFFSKNHAFKSSPNGVELSTLAIDQNICGVLRNIP